MPLPYRVSHLLNFNMWFCNFATCEETVVVGLTVVRSVVVLVLVVEVVVESVVESSGDDVDSCRRLKRESITS